MTAGDHASASGPRPRLAVTLDGVSSRPLAATMRRGGPGPWGVASATGGVPDPTRPRPEDPDARYHGPTRERRRQPANVGGDEAKAAREGPGALEQDDPRGAGGPARPTAPAWLSPAHESAAGAWKHERRAHLSFRRRPWSSSATCSAGSTRGEQRPRPRVGPADLPGARAHPARARVVAAPRRRRRAGPDRDRDRGRAAAWRPGHPGAGRDPAPLPVRARVAAPRRPLEAARGRDGDGRRASHPEDQRERDRRARPGRRRRLGRDRGRPGRHRQRPCSGGPAT